MSIQQLSIQCYWAVKTGLGKLWEPHDTKAFESISVHSVEWNLIERLFFQPMKILHHTHQTPPIMLPAFYLFFYKIHYRNSWIINNLNSSQAKIQRRCKNIQPYYILKCLRPSSNVAFLLRRIQCK